MKMEEEIGKLIGELLGESEENRVLADKEQEESHYKYFIAISYNCEQIAIKLQKILENHRKSKN